MRGRLFGWSARVGIAAAAVAFTASAFAQPLTPTRANKKQVARTNAPHSGCYVTLSSSPFPQPCDRVSATPSTASPMVIIGEAPKMVRR